MYRAYRTLHPAGGHCELSPDEVLSACGEAIAEAAGNAALAGPGALGELTELRFAVHPAKAFLPRGTFAAEYEDLYRQYMEYRIAMRDLWKEEGQAL